MNKTIFHETVLYWGNRPLVTLLSKVTGRLSRCVYLPRIGYIVNDLELSKQILSHADFSSAGRGGMGGMITPVVGENALINMDGPRHRELKQKLAGLFSRKYIGLIIEEALNATLHELKQDLLSGQEVDLVKIVHQITNRMTCHMLGIKLSGTAEQQAAIYQEIATLAAKLTALLKVEKLEPNPRDLQLARKYYRQLLAFANFNEAQNEAGLPESNALLHRVQSLGLSRAETEGLLVVILLAGTETVSAALPRIVAHLLDSEQFAELSQNRALLPNAIDEGLRLACASPAILRGVAQDVELDGITFKKDRRVIVLLYNVLKQKSHFSQPEEFRLKREISQTARNLWFGDGPHFCLGFLLAQQEISAVLNVLLDLPGKLQIKQRRYPRGQSFPGYTRLTLKLNQKTESSKL